MKIKSFKNSIRFIDSNKDWWRIKYPADGIPTILQHRCRVPKNNSWIESASKLAWNICYKEPKTTGIFCAECEEYVPDEVVAAAKLMGAELEEIKLNKIVYPFNINYEMGGVLFQANYFRN